MLWPVIIGISLLQFSQQGWRPSQADISGLVGPFFSCGRQSNSIFNVHLNLLGFLENADSDPGGLE